MTEFVVFVMPVFNFSTNSVLQPTTLNPFVEIVVITTCCLSAESLALSIGHITVLITAGVLSFALQGKSRVMLSGSLVLI